VKAAFGSASRSGTGWSQFRRQTKSGRYSYNDQTFTSIHKLKIQDGMPRAALLDQSEFLKTGGDEMRKIFLAFISLMAVAPLALGQAKDFPNRAIKVIVPFTAGSGSDTSARFFGEKMSAILGQTVVVENRPGASGVIAVSAVKSAPADGHTILLASISLMSVNPVTVKDLPYDPLKDLKPIAGLSRGMAAIIVPQNSKLVTLADVVKASKDDKKSLSAGTYSAGYHLIFEWFANLAGIKFNHIPYKGGGPLATDGVAGHVPVTMATYALWAPHFAGGRLRPLAVTSSKRMPELPDVPTLQELGIDGFEAQAYWGLLGPAGIPASIVNRMNAEVAKALKLPAVQERLVQMGVAITSSSPQEFDRFIRNEIDKWGKVVKDNNIKAGQ
jgi:tripartite-type tricarboxylate transporter receptor subunit TctC